MKVCQNARLLFLCTKPRLSQAGALLLSKDFVSLGIRIFTMTKIHFRPYNPNQTVLFPQRIDEDIAENDPVRMVDALVESLNLESFRKLIRNAAAALTTPNPVTIFKSAPRTSSSPILRSSRTLRIH